MARVTVLKKLSRIPKNYERENRSRSAMERQAGAHREKRDGESRAIIAPYIIYVIPRSAHNVGLRNQNALLMQMPVAHP